MPLGGSLPHAWFDGQIAFLAVCDAADTHLLPGIDLRPRWAILDRRRKFLVAAVWMWWTSRRRHRQYRHRRRSMPSRYFTLLVPVRRQLDASFGRGPDYYRASVIKGAPRPRIILTGRGGIPKSPRGRAATPRKEAVSASHEIETLFLSFASGISARAYAGLHHFTSVRLYRDVCRAVIFW